MRLLYLPRYLFGALFGLLFFVSAAVAQVGEIEPNNAPATAQVIVLGTEYVGRISSGTPADTGDYFRFSLTSPGNVTLRLKPQTAGGNTASNWRIKLFDYATGNELLGFDVGRSDPVGATTSVGLGSGNYYVSIEANGGGVIDIPYLFAATLATGNYFEREFNDSPSNAQPIVFGADYLGRLQDRISSSVAEFDYYKFSLTSPGNITLRLKPQTAGGNTASNWRVKLFDYLTGNELLGFNVGRSDPVGGTTSVGLGSGNYYVSIEANGGGVIDIPYLFTTTLVAGNYFEQEFNDSPASAQPISFGAEYLGRRQSRISSSVAEFDYYKFSLTTSSSIALRLRPQTAGGNTASTWRIRLRDYATNNALIDFTVGRSDPLGGTNTSSLPAGNY